MIRNRVHVIIDRQRGLELPVCSDLFGKKGLHWLRKLKLRKPDGLSRRIALAHSTPGDSLHLTFLTRCGGAPAACRFRANDSLGGR